MRFLSGLLAAAAVLGQSFEVASVRPAGPTRPRGLEGTIRGGPGSSSPERMVYPWVTLRTLLTLAYSVPPDQISGPGWIDEQRYDIEARVAPGATKEQLNPMLRGLIEERFHLTFHRMAKDFPVYELIIAKGGPKLKENADPNLKPARPGDYDPGSVDRDGYPILPEGVSGSAGRPVNGVIRSTYRGMPISSLISTFGMELGTEIPGSMWAPARIIDKTGLTGKYDFHLETTLTGAGKIGGALLQTPSADPQAPNGGPTLFEALERQLGLRLEQKKARFDVLVIDHADRIPTEN